MKGRIKKFIFNLLKSLNPKYYRDLAEKDISSAFLYFLVLLGFSFAVMLIIAIPSLFFLKQDLNQAVLDITKLDTGISFQTAKPISLPSDNSIITLDTTNNKTIGNEFLFVTDKSFSYNLFNKRTEVEIKPYNINNDRRGLTSIVSWLFIFLLPSFLAFFYLAYLLKYAIIIIPTALISFVVAKLFRNRTHLKEAIVLSIYTSTLMVLIEILTIPFFFNKYIISYSPIVGVNFSIIAITAYLVLYVTAIRLNGSRKLY